MTQAPNGIKPQTNGITNCTAGSHVATPENISHILRNDNKVKVAGIDADGILRGKLMAKDKFIASVEKGFGMSSAIFGWDMHDELYSTETKISTAEEGYADFIAVPDLSSFRRLPWENDIAFFLLHFVAQDKPVYADGRSMLRGLTQKLESLDWKSLAGGTCIKRNRR